MHHHSTSTFTARLEMLRAWAWPMVLRDLRLQLPGAGVMATMLRELTARRVSLPPETVWR